MKNQILINYIILLLGAGYRVFVKQGLKDLCKVTYCTFAKGDKLGYCQVNSFGIGLDFTTVHKPSRSNGTGFSSHKEVVSPDLVHASDTVNGYSERGKVEKYESVDEYLRRQIYPSKEVFCSDFKQVVMCSVRDFYYEVIANYGEGVAERFIQLMIEWDGQASGYHAFYDVEVLEMKLEEAINW